MGWLEKEFILHECDENGKLLPIDFPIKELEGRKVTVFPVKRGRTLRLIRDLRDSAEIESMPLIERLTIIDKLKELEHPFKTTSDIWLKYAQEHLLKPNFSLEELDNHKKIIYDGRPLNFVDLIIGAIDKVSGLEVKNPEKTEEKLQKNSKSLPE